MFVKCAIMRSVFENVPYFQMFQFFLKQFAETKGSYNLNLYITMFKFYSCSFLYRNLSP